MSCLHGSSNEKELEKLSGTGQKKFDAAVGTSQTSATLEKGISYSNGETAYSGTEPKSAMMSNSQRQTFTHCGDKSNEAGGRR